MKDRWRHYIPAAMALGMALFFLAVPALAVFFVVTGLTVFGALYAWIVHRLHKQVTRARAASSADTAEPGGAEAAPNFRTVTINMVRWGNEFRPDGRFE